MRRDIDATARVFQVLCICSIILCATFIVHGQTPSPEPDTRPLPLGSSLERSIKPGEIHDYYVELKAGQLLRLEAREKSTDLRCWLVRVADEKWLAHSISPFDLTTLSFVAEEPGFHIIFVEAQKYTTSKASYKLTASLSLVAAQDRDRIKAEAISEENAYGGDDRESLVRAIQKLEESLEYWKRVKDPYWEPFVRYALGRLNYKIGELGKALDQFSQACLLFSQAEDLDGKAWSKNYLGLVHHALGDHESAYKELDQANHLFVQLLDPQGAIATVNNLGLVFMEIARPEKALGYYEQALPALRDFGDLHGEAAVLNNISKIYGGFGDAKKELDYAQQASQLFRRIGDLFNEAFTVNNIGGAYDKLGRQQEAYESYRQALPLLKAAGDKRHEAHVLANLLHACKLLKKPRLAVFYGKQAINRYQELRSSVTSLDEELQKTYARSFDISYRELSELLIEQGRLAEALQLLNSFKDQQYFDFNPASRRKLTPLTLTPREVFFSELYDRKAAQALRLASLRNIGNIERNAEQIVEAEAERKIVSDTFLVFFNQVEHEFSQPPTERDAIGEIKDLREWQEALKVLSQSDQSYR